MKIPLFNCSFGIDTKETAENVLIHIAKKGATRKENREAIADLLDRVVEHTIDNCLLKIGLHGGDKLDISDIAEILVGYRR